VDGWTRFWRWFYNNTAWAYDAIVGLGTRLGIGSEQNIMVELLSRIPIKSGELIVDIGCGTASNRPAFDAAAHYFGFDISGKMLGRAKSKSKKLNLKANFVEADAIWLPLPNSRVGLVIAMGLLQHIGQKRQSLQEMARVAKADAQILLIDEIRSLGNSVRRLTGRIGKNDQIQEIETWCRTELKVEVSSSGFLGDYFFIGFFKSQPH
jgi:ubiquinone/menaquinone biosynthesis C-methylase UbiE